MKNCPVCGAKLDWCYGGGGHAICFSCGFQSEGCHHQKPYLFNLDKNQKNIYDILERIRENLDSQLFTLETHADVQRINERMHQIVRDGFLVEVILRKKGRV